MRGGMKVYAGSATAARAYLEADRGRADDYYLTEGTGPARRFVARDGRVAERAPLTGDAYQTWVAGRDPDTGDPGGGCAPMTCPLRGRPQDRRPAALGERRADPGDPR